MNDLTTHGWRACGSIPADTYLGDDGPLCDPCFDRRISESSGLPRLPEVPEPVVLTDADGRQIRCHHRMRRVATGIALELRQDGAEPGEGFVFAVLGNHDADLATLADALRRRAETEVGRRWLEPAAHRHGWQVADTEVAGRLVYNPDGGPYRVVVDGRAMSWGELGETLESFEGWCFRLVIEDRITDLRSDAEVVDLPSFRGHDE